VVPDEIPSDDTLEKRLSASLAHNSLTSGAEIAVTADDGTVTLYGKVESRAVKDEAFKLAALTKGVAAIKDEIQVKFAWPFMTDDEIRDEIEQEMRWSLFVDADQIDVSVKDGIATLSGRVRTWRERLAAAENAYEGGAHTVINNVEVEQGAGY
jgi:osmotically-inducible protein OsmY